MIGKKNKTVIIIGVNNVKIDNKLYGAEAPQFGHIVALNGISSKHSLHI
jgi:hypothetical protein